MILLWWNVCTVRGFFVPSLTRTTRKTASSWLVTGSRTASLARNKPTTTTKINRAFVGRPLLASLPTPLDAETTESGDAKKPSTPSSINESRRSSSPATTARLAESYLSLPRHHSHPGVNQILQSTEVAIRQLHKHSTQIQTKSIQAAKEAGRAHEKVYANNYVDLGKVDTIGFDFDYTLVTYSEELLDLIYDMALNRLVTSRQYPLEMLDSGLQFDPFFSIRGLAVDTKTGWVCHLSSTHKVAVAYEGRNRVPTSRIYHEYRGKRGMPPAERKRRLRPLNDL